MHQAEHHCYHDRFHLLRILPSYLFFLSFHTLYLVALQSLHILDILKTSYMLHFTYHCPVLLSDRCISLLDIKYKYILDCRLNQMGTKTLRLCSAGQQTKGKKTTESGKQKQGFSKYTVSEKYGGMYSNNLHFSAAVLLSDNNYSKVELMSRFLALACPSKASFFRVQKFLLYPSN